MSKSTVRRCIKHLKDSDYIKVSNIMGKGGNRNPFIAGRVVKSINWKKIDKMHK